MRDLPRQDWGIRWHEIQLTLQETGNSALGGAGRFRISRLLAIGQIALAVIVITAAGVMTTYSRFTMFKLNTDILRLYGKMMQDEELPQEVQAALRKHPS